MIPPSIQRRRKVWHRCVTCGRDVRKGDTRIVKTGRHKGELMHGKHSRVCGPVAFALNPAYRKQQA
jgi:hypothetical protein